MAAFRAISTRRRFVRLAARALPPLAERPDRQIAFILRRVLDLTRGNVPDQFGQGYRIAGSFESLGRYAFNMAWWRGKAKTREFSN